MSSARANPEGVPCPREVWRAATKGKRITITVQPEHGSVVEFSGVVTDSRKVGNHANSYVTVQFVPDGELAPVEIEAGKERDEWGPFRAFHWTVPDRPEVPDEHIFQFVGRVTALDIPGGRWKGPGDAAAGEGAV